MKSLLHNNKLLGFKDIEWIQDRGDEEYRGSNILQLFFKSLFAKLLTRMHTNE
jgi:hypothetical protein